MARFWLMPLAVCLFFALVGGWEAEEKLPLDWEEGLGVQKCPECPLKECNSHEVSSVEKGKIPLLTANRPLHCSEKGSAFLVSELQRLMEVQQLQIDQLADLLQQLQKPRTTLYPEVVHVLKEPTAGIEVVEITDKDESKQSLLHEAAPSGLGSARDGKLEFLEAATTIVKTGREHIILGEDDTTTRLPDAVELELLEDTATTGSSKDAEHKLVDAITTGLPQAVKLDIVETKTNDIATSELAAKVVVPLDSESPGGITVARYKPAWLEHFSFLSAVKVDGEVSCLHILPQEGDDGVSRYVVVGDMTGRLYIFIWLGDLLLDFSTRSTSPITAMLSYTILKNETILVTGHADGAVLVHQISETMEQGPVLRDGSPTLSSIETLHSLVPPSASTLRGRVTSKSDLAEETGDLELGDADNMSVLSGMQAVGNLEMYKVGKVRYTLVGDVSGKIQLFRDNGSLYQVAQSPLRPLAFMRTPNAQRLVFLTEAGVGSVDLRSMVVSSSPCEGLGGSKVMAYAFDVTQRSKASGFTPEGELVSVALTGDILHFQCHVKKKRKVEVTGPFSIQALRGYLLAATPDRVLGFNTTLPAGLSYANFWVAGPRPIFSVTKNEIALPFTKTPITQSRRPLMATNKEKMVVVGFGDGYVGVFRSNLPTGKVADFTAKFWNSSILVCAIAVLVLWQLLSRKKEPGAVVSSDPLTLASGASASHIVDSVRMGFGERPKVQQRRFKSPTRGYVSTHATSFRRDFRGSGMESDISYSRREPLFSSIQPVGESQLRQ